MASIPGGSAAQTAFDRAYQVLIDAWPTPVKSRRVPTAFGATHHTLPTEDADQLASTIEQFLT